ncbi:hypothetical protein ACFSTH_06485 [Paenibacillus yanchengensis]|uniref:Transposase n=1 Tax=Paenibacillus yanchengensis TaxID=2035833 RepID=A0ABW4YIH4_9BACL
MELMPAWKRWGYEEGHQEGRIELQKEIIGKMLNKGLTPEDIAKMLELPLDEVKTQSNK